MMKRAITASPKATSTWLVFRSGNDVGMVRIPDWLESLTRIPRGKNAMEVAKGKIPPAKSESPTHISTVRWHEVDTNKHLSNTHYFQYAIEALPMEVLSEKRLSMIDLNFRSECSWEDQLSSTFQDMGDGNYLHLIKRLSDDKILALVKSLWVN